MKKIFFVLLCLPFFAGAQSLLGGKNILKWNTSSTALRNYSFTYERSILKHLSVSLSYRVMPKGNVPFQEQFADAIQSDDIDFGNMQMANTAWTIEPRIYVGIGRMKGFYLSPYIRFADFDIFVPISYNNGTGGKNNATFEGTVKSTSGGLMVGWQFQILNKIVLDFQIVGLHLGNSSGVLDFKQPTPLTPVEKAGLQKTLNDIDPGPFKFTSTMNDYGAQIHPTGWAGVRGLNLGIGLRF